MYETIPNINKNNLLPNLQVIDKNIGYIKFLGLIDKSQIDLENDIEFVNNDVCVKSNYLSNMEYIVKINNYAKKNISTKIKDQMNYNTQSIDQQISKSNNLENTNKQLTMKRDKDVYLKTIAEINSNNYASIQSTEYRNLVVKIIITGILIIIFIFLLQSALNKYNININGQ